MSSDPFDSKQRFSNRVCDYVAGRPSYPSALIQLLGDMIGFDKDWLVADIGAGTGISSRLFIENGNRVIAVEPNEMMRQQSEAELASYGLFTSIAAPAEATTLLNNSIDLVVAAQAFHWFDHDRFALECLRILKPKGQVMLMWNNVQFGTTPFTTAYQAFMRKYSLDLNVVEKRWRDSDEVARNWFTGNTFKQIELPNPQAYSQDDLIARVASSSYMPGRDHPRFDLMLSDLNQLFNQWQSDGRVVLPHNTRVYQGKPKEPK